MSPRSTHHTAANAATTTGVETGLRQRLAVVLASAMLGSLLLVGAGFAQSSALHDAAHDARHAFTFPCH